MPEHPDDARDKFMATPRPVELTPTEIDAIMGALPFLGSTVFPDIPNRPMLFHDLMGKLWEARWRGHPDPKMRHESEPGPEILERSD